GADARACYAQIKRYVDNFRTIDEEVKGLIKGQPVKTLCEYDVSYLPKPDKRMVVTGIVDRVDVYRSVDENMAVIIDYKTNRAQDAGAVQALAHHYGIQLKLYARAVKELLYIQNRGIDKVRMILYLLDCGQWAEVPYDDHDIDDLIGRMNTALSVKPEGGGVQDYPRRPGRHCMWCSYKMICDKVGDS
ncbi:MAG: PD-(D/E)XK nuclease family protein, partial [Mahellales bacterium]